MNKIKKDDLSNDILNALKNRKYKARTLYGIAKELSKSENLIAKEINENAILKRIIKIYPRHNSNGDLLYTTKERFYEEASVKDKFIDFFHNQSFKKKEK